LGWGKKEGSGQVGSWAAGWKREGEREGLGRFSFFKTFVLNLFKLSKLFSKFKHFKPFASFQIILKSFKTSHPHS
jgi:hypothetical protein